MREKKISISVEKEISLTEKVSFHMPKKEKLRLEIKWKHYLYIHDLKTGNDPFGKSCSLP